MGYEKAGGRDVWGGPCSGTRFLSGDIASNLATKLRRRVTSCGGIGYPDAASQA